MHRLIRAVVLLGFTGFLVVPLVATIAGMRPAPLENRPEAARPDLGDVLVGDSDAVGELQRFLVDRFAFRSAAIRADAKLNEVLWRDDKNGVVRGLDDWLFLRQSFTRLCTKEMTVPDALAELDRFADGVSASTFRWVVVPAKPSIHQEKLGGHSGKDPDALCGARERDAMREALSKQEWSIDLYEPMAAAARTGETFHPRDTHWNNLGSLAGTKAVVDALDENLWAGVSIETTEGPFQEGLSRQMGLPFETRTPRSTPIRPGVSSVRSSDVPILDVQFPPHRHLGSGLALWPGRTVIVHDSFLVVEDVYEQYVPFFADITFVHWDTVGDPQVDESILAADTLIMEVAERLVTNRVGEKIPELER